MFYFYFQISLIMLHLVNHVSIESCLLYFLIISLFLMTGTILRSIGKILSRISINWDLPDVFLMVILR